MTQQKNTRFCELLKSERLKLGLDQPKFAELAGVSTNSQSNYETGKAVPNAKYLMNLAAMGVDILLLLTGKKSKTHLTNQESMLLELFREADKGVQRHILAGLLQDNPDKNDKTIINQQSSDNHGTIIGVGTTKK